MPKITDDGTLHRYRTEIPNTLIRGKKSVGLSIYAKWLYVYLKSVAGDAGICYRSTTTIAQESGISRTQVSGAKHDLVRHHLITVTSGKNPRRDSDRISIQDIWPENMNEFCVPIENTGHTDNIVDGAEEYGVSVPIGNTQDTQCSNRELQCSNRELGVPVVAQKKISLRRSHEEENPFVLTTVKTFSQTTLKEIVTGLWIAERYNAETPPDHPKHSLPLSPARLKRANDYARRFPDPAFWHAVFAEIWRSPWLRGQRTGARRIWA